MRRRRKEKESGIALLAALLLLLMLTGLSVAMFFSAKSDLLVNGYYRDYRGSFYAADSGLNIVRQDMVAQINNDLATVGAGYNPASGPPLTQQEDSNIASYVSTTYGNFKAINTGNAANSWPGSYQITNPTFKYIGCTLLGTTSSTGDCKNPLDKSKITGYEYNFQYSLTAVGTSRLATQKITLFDTGNVFVKATGSVGSTTTSFAAWGMFINSYTACDGTFLVPGTISGPVFTNGSWNFGTTGQYIFTDSVGSAGGTAGFQFPSGSPSCDALAATSDKKGGSTIAPTFQHGFNLSQPTVPLPGNAYSQEQAVLDGIGNNNGPISKQSLSNSNLLDVNGKGYPKNGASNGVYLPYTTDSNGVPTGIAGGGIFVEGDAQITLSPGANGTAQVYTIVQGGVTTTVTIDPGPGAATCHTMATCGVGATTLTQGGKTVTIPGVPFMKDQVSGSLTGDDTMLYVDGNITSLSGPGQGKPAIQDGAALTITAADNVTITGDILYKTEPVTTTQNQIQNTPADTLIPNNDKGQTLGIFTATGDIQLKNSQANGNLEIDASLATLCDPTADCGKAGGGNGGLTNIGASINTLTIIGGRIQNTIKGINTTTRNVFFDRRYAQGLAPPWFPSTQVQVAPGTPTKFDISVSRLQWENQSSRF